MQSRSPDVNAREQENDFALIKVEKDTSASTLKNGI